MLPFPISFSPALQQSSMSTGEALVEQALRSGEWVEVVDQHTGKRCYHHPKTNKVVRDLRLELLREYNPLTHKPAAVGEDQHSKKESKADWLKEPTLEEQLKAARDLNNQYELELQHLRHCLFTNADPEKASQTMTSAKKHLLQSSQPKDEREKILQLEEKVRVLQELNTRLYNRVVLDRETRNLCSSCGEYTLPELASGSKGFGIIGPRFESMQPYVLRAGDEIRMQGTKKDSPYFAEDTILRRPPLDRGALAPSSGAYLPSTLSATNVTTTHAPLHTLTTDPTAKGIPGRRFELPVDMMSISSRQQHAGQERSVERESYIAAAPDKVMQALEARHLSDVYRSPALKRNPPSTGRTASSPVGYQPSPSPVSR